jgi:hypothetical protein
MYNLTIHFGPNAVAWSFLFKDEGTARSHMLCFLKPDDIKDPAMDHTILIEDDYGQLAYIVLGQVHGVLLENMELGAEARIIRGIDQAKGQMRANKRAMNDPEIQQLQRDSRSPNIISPFPSGGLRQ